MPKLTCVHCRSELPAKSKTKDHVFPRSWFPDSTPNNVNRWTVPSCRECNKSLGTKEKELFIRMALCADPRKAAAAGLSIKALRALGIGVSALDAEEERHRKKLKDRLLRDIRPHQAGDATLPGFGLHEGFPGVEQQLVFMPANLLNDVARKIVRGCEYVMGEKRIVEPPYEISLFAIEAANRPEEFAGFKTNQIGPGFRVARVAAREDPKSTIYEIVVWETWTFYASVLTP